MSDKLDHLDNLVREIFELIDTYYIEWQAEQIKLKILEFCEETNPTSSE